MTDEETQSIVIDTENFHYTECEGVLLVAAEDHGFNAWLPIGEEDAQLWLEITWRPQNYPKLNVSLIHISEEELASHIQSSCCGMVPLRLNLGNAVVKTIGAFNQEIIADLDEDDLGEDDENEQV